jgi:hypothetical protein
MPNTLSFSISNPERSDVTVVTPVIDGVELTELVTQFEIAQGYNDPAGQYGGLVPDWFNYGPLDRYFLADTTSSYFANNPARIYVLGCECGEVGCWPLECTVDVREDAVVWRDFRQPHREKRDYAGFGHFTFNRAQYEAALAGLPT